MIDKSTYVEVRLLRFPRVVSAFCVLALGLLVLVAVLAEQLFQTVLAPVVLFTAVSVMCLWGLSFHYPRDSLGACNVVTTARAALVAILAGAILEPGTPWIVFGIALTAFALDGVDGWLARRAGMTSAFGARFDMETDTLLGAVLVLVLLADGRAGPAILVLGFTRYAFILAGLRWRVLRGHLPPSLRRKAICCLQIAALIIIVFPLTPEILMQPVALVAAAALVYSFASDIVFLVRQGGREGRKRPLFFYIGHKDDPVKVEPS